MALCPMKCVCLTCQRFQKFDPSWYSACLCIVVSVGGPYASGALSAFVRVSRQKKYCHVFCVILCHVCIFFLSNKQFSSSSSSSSSWFTQNQKYTVGCRYRAANIVPHPHKTTHSSPLSAIYGVSFVSSMSDLTSAVGIAVLYVISWYIR